MYEEMYAPLPDCEAYAKRIRMPWPLTPDLPTLDRIVFQHQCQVPFENMEPYDEGRQPSLDIPALFDKVVTRRRGGFCFELNAALCAFLQGVGYDAWSVTCRIVRGRDFLPPMLHRAVVVRLDGTDYYCDVGYGGPQPGGPVPLGRERVVCGESFWVEPLEEPWWRLCRITSQGVRENVIEFPNLPMTATYFIPYNYYCAANPGSLFAQKRVINLRTAEGSLALTGTTFTERRGGETMETELHTREEVSAVLRDRFGLEMEPEALRWE